MPSGKRAKQQRREASAGKPPPVRSKGASGRTFQLSQRTLLAGVVLVVLIGLGVGLGVGLSGRSGGSSGLQAAINPPPLGKNGFEGVPLESGQALARPGALKLGASIDHIACGSGEELAFHIHVRLTIFVDGQQRAVPAGVGYGDPQVQNTAQGPEVGSGSCVSWLHTHTTDGIVHIESPLVRHYTLGNFFDLWKQPLSSTQVGPARGAVTVLVNGKVWSGDPRNVPLNADNQIQLDVGTPLVNQQLISSWPPGL